MAKNIPDTPSRSAYFSLMTAADILGGEFARLFRNNGITPTVFNTMRILIQGPSEGQRIGEIGEQLIQRVPDITRLIDRMERDGFVRRQGDPEDRRAVRIKLTPAGKRKCESLYSSVSKGHREQFSHMSDRELMQIDKLLKKLMSG